MGRRNGCHVLKRGYYLSDVFWDFAGFPHFIIALKRRSPEKTWVIRADIDTYVLTDMVNGVRIGKIGRGLHPESQGIFPDRTAAPAGSFWTRTRRLP